MNETIREELKQKIENNPQFFVKSIKNEDTKNHLINVAISIINTRDKTGPTGGSFVQAIISNDFVNIISRADVDCINALRFFSNVNEYYHPIK